MRVPSIRMIQLRGVLNDLTPSTTDMLTQSDAQHEPAKVDSHNVCACVMGLGGLCFEEDIIMCVNQRHRKRSGTEDAHQSPGILLKVYSILRFIIKLA